MCSTTEVRTTTAAAVPATTMLGVSKGRKESDEKSKLRESHRL
jgi:hypothetical protein